LTVNVLVPGTYDLAMFAASTAKRGFCAAEGCEGDGEIAM